MRYSLPLIGSTLLTLQAGAASAYPQHHPHHDQQPPSCKPGEWVELAPLPIARQEHATVALDENTIGVLGGTIPSGIMTIPGTNGSSSSPSSSSSSIITTVETTSLFHLYDIPTNTWRSAPPAPKRLNHPNVAVLDGKLYLLGGLHDDAPPTSSSSGGVGGGESLVPPNWLAWGGCYVYDPSAQTWEELDSTTIPAGMERGSAAVGVHEESKMIYLAGGMTILSEYQNAVRTVIGLNATTSSPKWQYLGTAAQGAELPEGRQHAVGGVIVGGGGAGGGAGGGSKFYVLGGRTYGQEMTRDTVLFLDLEDPAKEGWQVGDAKLSVPRGGLSGAVVGGKDFYTFGGEGNTESRTGVFDQAEVLKTGGRNGIGEEEEDEKMVELSPMALPRHGTQAAAVGDRVYIPGGGLQQDGLPVVQANGTVTYGNPTARFQAYCV